MQQHQSFEVVTPGPSPAGLTIWSLNTCSLKTCDLLPLAQAMADTSAWDILCLQEGVHNATPGLHTEAGLWILSGQPSQVGVPRLLLNSRLGSRVRQTKTHTHYVMAEIGLIPPLITFSLYLPPYSAHSDASFEATLEQFITDLKLMQKSSPGSFVLGGGDCNTQLSRLKGHVGRFTGTNERPCDQERQEHLLAFLADMDLTVPATFADTGPTRKPWPGQTRQKPSKIHFIISSKRLTATPITDDKPTPSTSIDHQPVGLFAVAPHASRRDDANH